MGREYLTTYKSYSNGICDEDDEYFQYLTDRSCARVTVLVSFVLVISGATKSYSDSTLYAEIPAVIYVFRALTFLALCSYAGTLCRIKSGKESCSNLKWCGNLFLLLNGLVAAMWIHFTMIHREGPELPGKTVVSCLITVCLNMIYPVHSPWSSAVVVVLETVLFLIGAAGSPLSTYLKVGVLCTMIVFATFVNELNQINSYKSHCEKIVLMQQLEQKNVEMRTLIGNVAHDLKVMSCLKMPSLI